MQHSGGFFLRKCCSPLGVGRFRLRSFVRTVRLWRRRLTLFKLSVNMTSKQRPIFCCSILLISYCECNFKFTEITRSPEIFRTYHIDRQFCGFLILRVLNFYHSASNNWIHESFHNITDLYLWHLSQAFDANHKSASIWTGGQPLAGKATVRPVFMPLILQGQKKCRK